MFEVMVVIIGIALLPIAAMVVFTVGVVAVRLLLVVGVPVVAVIAALVALHHIQEALK